MPYVRETHGNSNMSSGTLTRSEASWEVTHDTEHRLRSENLAFDIGQPENPNG
jgi:hypothetical protein